MVEVNNHEAPNEDFGVPFAERSDDELVDCDLQLFAVENSVRFQRLKLLNDIFDRQFWIGGSRKFHIWLAEKYQLDPNSAKDLAKVSQRFHELPHLMDKFRNGVVSWDQLVQLCEFVQPADDERLARDAETFNFRELRELANAHRRREEDKRAPALRRGLTMAWNREHDRLRIRGYFDIERGAIVENTLKRLANELDTNPGDPAREAFPQRLADALVLSCEKATGTNSTKAKPSMIVHVRADVLAGIQQGVAHIEDSTSIHHEVARRIACDSDVRLVFDGSDGRPVGVGRQTRRINPWLKSHLRRRDKACCFPGCLSDQYLHEHHIEHWVNGGATDANNLITLCSRHHQFVHDNNWTIVGNPEVETVAFVDSEGTVHQHLGRPIQARANDRVQEILGDILGPPIGPVEQQIAEDLHEGSTSDSQRKPKKPDRLDPPA